MDSMPKTVGVMMICIIFMFAITLGAIGYNREQYSEAEYVVTEGTVTDKNVSSRIISVQPLISTNAYCLTVNVAEGTYSVTVPCDTYNSINVGDSLMFNLAYKDDAVMSVSIATAEDLTELVTE